MLGAAVSMFLAFNTLEEDRTAPTEALSENIGTALTFTAGGIILGLFGAILILTAFFAAKNREYWFFLWTVILSAVWCLAIFPIGLIVGVPFLILFLSRRTEFMKAAKA